jgi:hypothetical protein|tara:strand:+ start:1051 stop:1371 length:321 start_codon:yes stop_codon:yes gene_type:complete
MNDYGPKSEQKTPNIFNMISSFARELKTYIAEGAPNVTTEDYVERLEACDSCEHLIREKMRCGLCGCLLEHKAKWKTTTCPDKPTRWKEQILDGERQEGDNTNASN